MKIVTFADYISALSCKKSEYEPIKIEAIAAIKEFKKKDYDKYVEFECKFNPKKARKHEKSNRELAAERLPGRMSLLWTEIPAGLKLDDFYKAFYMLPEEELLDNKGKLAQRGVLIRRTVSKALQEGLVDREEILRRIQSHLNRLFKNDQITFFIPYSKVKELIRSATTEELLKVAPNCLTVYTEKLLNLLDRKYRANKNTTN